MTGYALLPAGEAHLLVGSCLEVNGGIIHQAYSGQIFLHFGQKQGKFWLLRDYC